MVKKLEYLNKRQFLIILLSLFLAVAFIYLYTAPANALTCTWDGDTDTKISTAGNWEQTGCPGTNVSDNTYTIASSSQSIIWDFQDAPNTIGSLFLNSGFTG